MLLSRVGFTLGGAGAGWAAALVVGAGAKTIIVIAAVGGALIINGIAKAVESIYKRLPQIIKAQADGRAKIIEARADRRAKIIGARVRAKLLRAGLKADKTQQAAEMLRLQPLDAALPLERRIKDDLLAKLLQAPKTSSRGADKPDNGGPQDGDDGNVRPIRSTSL